MSGIIPKFIRNGLVRPLHTASYSTKKRNCQIQLMETAFNTGPTLNSIINKYHTSAFLKARETFKPGAGRRVILGETKGYSPDKLRGPIYDESVDTKETISALESVHAEEQAGENELFSESIYPDETTADKIFHGVK